MRKIKKIISIILIICLSLCSSVLVFAEKVSSEKDFAEYVVGGTQRNIDIFQHWNGLITEKGGKKALERSPGDGSTPYILIGVSDDFIYEPEGEQAVIISVEYFDEGNGCFTITYDGIHNIPYGKSKTLLTNSPDIVQLENTKKWKTHEFYIDDAKFTNGFQGADFRIALWAMEMGMSPDKVYFGSVKIEKTYMRDPIRIKENSNCYGNIFGPGEKNMSLEMKNVLDEPITAKFQCSIFDENDKRIDETEFEESFKAKQIISKSADLFGVKKFGLYTLKINITFNRDVGEGMREYSSEEDIEFSFINKPKEKNKNLFVSAHGLEAGIDSTTKLARYGGFGGVRDEINWSDVEKVKGKLSAPENADVLVSKLTEEDLSTLLILGYENSLYDGGQTPHTDEGIKAYANYCAYMAKRYKGIVDTFEIWNEYNISLFNSDPSKYDGAMYAKMLKAAYTAIKEANPNATVVGICAAGTDLAFMKKVLDNGGYDYMDAVSFHPYQWTGKFDIDLYLKNLRDVKALFEQYGGAKPIWVTEVGATSSECSAGVGETMQADYAVQMYVSSREDSLCDRMYWYCLQNVGIDPTSQEHGFGLVRAEYDTYTPHAAKPAMVAVAGMNSLLCNAKFLEKRTIGNTRVYKFEKANGNNIYAFWSDVESESVTLKCESKKVAVYDMYTNKISDLSNAAGMYNILSSKKVMYLEEIPETSMTIKIDNIVIEKGKCSISISLKNNGNETSEDVLTWDILNSSDKIVNSGSKDRTIDAKQKLIFGLDAGNLQKGRYTIKIRYGADSSVNSVECDFEI